MGQGLRRRPRHADRGRARGAAARPHARARRRLPRRRPRGRDGRRVRLLPARQGRRGAVDRHRDARPRRRRRTSTTCTPTPASRIATAADGEALTTEIFGDRVVWVPWRRPGFQLGLDIAAIKAANPQAIGCILGGHGITAWGDTSDECRGELAVRSSDTAAGLPRRARHGRARSAPSLAGLRARCRRGRAPRARPPRSRRSIRGLASTDRPHGRALHRRPTSCSTSSPATKHPRLAELGTSLPGPLPAHQGQAAGARPARRRAASRTSIARLRELHAAYREDYAAYYDRHATAGLARDARRRPGDRARARRRDVLLRRQQADRPGRRRVLRQRDQRDARRRVGLDLRADRRVPRSSASSTGRSRRPSSQRMPKPKPLATRDRARHRRRRPASAGRSRTRLAAEGACVVVADLDARRRPQAAAAEIGGAGRRDRRRGRRHRRGAGRRPRSPRRCSRSAGVDLVVNNAGLSLSQAAAGDHRGRLGPAARRHGQGLVPRRREAAARAMIAQGMGGDIVYISSQELASSPARTTSPTARPRPTRRTRCACSPPSSASTASGSTASTPTASCAARASSPAAGAPTAPRSTASPRRSSARSTPSARCSSARCCPSTSPTPSFALTGGELSHTTGLHIPVDAGVAAAFLR